MRQGFFKTTAIDIVLFIVFLPRFILLLSKVWKRRCRYHGNGDNRRKKYKMGPRKKAYKL